MPEDTFRLPFLKLQIKKPKSWDFAALAAIIVAIGLAAANLAAALTKQPGTSLADGFTLALVLAQLAIASISLMILGKTAKYGTIWGNLGSIAGMLIGVSGVLLAAALWTAA
ncbi:MAG: hypothetical protein OES47_12030 [Acidobacteriota bacterium]|nr:hypothetical protein [Acidobacteriota bacterium]